MAAVPLYTYYNHARGGEAIVYFATDTNNQKVAIRVLKHTFTNERDATKRAIRELLFLKHCNHENIIKSLKQFVVTDGGNQMVAIVMPKMKYALDRFRDIPPPKECNVQDHRFGILQIIMHDTLSGIEYLHLKGIIHRDLSMRNIMFDDYSNATIIDFGLSHAPTPNTDLTEGIATMPYRAPELYTKNYDEKVDLWSIGTIFIELATGRPFYEPPFMSNDKYYNGSKRNSPVYTDDAFMDTFKSCCASKNRNIPRLPQPTTLRSKYPFDIWLPDYELNREKDPISAKREDAMILFEQLLQFCPDKRPTASEALKFDFFKLFEHSAPPPSEKISEILECKKVFEELDAIGNQNSSKEARNAEYIALLNKVVAQTERMPLDGLISLPFHAPR